MNFFERASFWAKINDNTTTIAIVIMGLGLGLGLIADSLLQIFGL